MREVICTGASFRLEKEGKFAYLEGVTPGGAEEISLYNALCLNCGDARIVPGDLRWSHWLEETFPGRFRTVTRFRLEGDETTFDPERLRMVWAAFPADYARRPFDDALMCQAAAEEWSSDFSAGLSDPERAVREGTCYAALSGDQIVSGCTGCVLSPELMEVEIITRKGFRKKGMASASAAGVLLKCLENGIRPMWDASSLFTVMLAQKQGFQLVREYQIYELSVEDL